MVVVCLAVEQFSVLFLSSHLTFKHSFQLSFYVPKIVALTFIKIYFLGSWFRISSWHELISRRGFKADSIDVISHFNSKPKWNTYCFLQKWWRWLKNEFFLKQFKSHSWYNLNIRLSNYCYRAYLNRPKIGFNGFENSQIC